MKIYINAIDKNGLDVKEEVDPSDLNLETGQIHYPGALKVKAHVEKDENVITVSCVIETIKRQICSRCLCEFDAPLEKKDDFIYKIGNGYSIDLDDNIKDILMLDYPIKILCKEDCKGLCSSCGKNLNEATCDCKRS